MDETLPEEPGQPALSPCDVEPTSETVRTSDAPVSSRLRSARCGSIASETNLLDHMSAQVAVGGTCPSNSGPLASPMHFHEAPASTAVRNASSNYSQSPSRSQVSRHNEWERGWPNYSGAFWAEDAILWALRSPPTTRVLGGRPSVQSAAPLAAMPRAIILRTAR